MNQLSWLLYAADVASSINFAFAAVFIICLIVTVICFLGTFEADQQEWAWPVFKRFGLYTFLFFLVAAPIPSKDTIYAIAVSEMGEQALATPLAGKATKALEAWLDKQIAGDDETEDK